METQVRPALRITFLVHVVFAGIFGLVFLLIPDTFASAAGATVEEPYMWRLVGTALLAFAASSVFAYREKVWEKVKIVVQMEIVWCILGTLATLWGLFYAGLPTADWMTVLILGGFAVAFTTLYYQA